MMSRWRPDSSDTDDDRCGEVHGGYKGQTFLDAAFPNDAFDFIGDRYNVSARFCIEGKVGGMGFHETVPPRAVRRSTCGKYRLLQADDNPLRSLHIGLSSLLSWQLTMLCATNTFIIVTPFRVLLSNESLLAMPPMGGWSIGIKLQTH